MGNIGPMEIAIVAIIALIVFGPSRLPELGSSLGKGMREFKSSISGEPSEDSLKAARLEAMNADDDANEVEEDANEVEEAKVVGDDDAKPAATVKPLDA